MEVLRDCLPSSVRRTLSELPESLDETYERILKEIKKPNRDLARRVLQCLVVATRPLRVAELAEVLAVDFDDAEGIPRLNPDWRWEDQEQALLIACSSLIAIVEAGDVKASDSNSDAEDSDSASEVEAGDSDYDVEASHTQLAETNDGDSHIEASNSDSKVDSSDSDLDVEAGHSDSEAETDDGDSHIEVGDSRIVQFSHFSVKEFLTSPRLATGSVEVSNYHIDLEPAHTILGQACLGVLLQTQDDVEGHTPEDHPLARYAAEHWTTHAQFGEVSSRLQKGMEYLFDPGKPHFKMWLTVHDIDRPDNKTFHRLTGNKSPAVPLYYAALCGFHNLVKHLMAKYPQDVNAHGGYYVNPLVAALTGEYFQTADLLHLNGADPNVQGLDKHTPLHAAVNCFYDCGNLEVALKLLEYGADINAENAFGSTPLHWASRGHHFEDGSVLRLLLKHGGDVNSRDTRGLTPLHEALGSEGGGLKVVPLLLKHGADIEAEDSNGRTALRVAVEQGHYEVVKLLLKHGADVEAEDSDGRTALRVAAQKGHDEVVKLLREHGAK